MSRSSLNTLVTDKILSGGRRTTASNAREVYSAMIAESVNLADDANVVNGYLAISPAGLVDVSFIKSASPTGLFLRDDGTWSAASGGASGLPAVLAIDNTTNEQIISSNNGYASLGIFDAKSEIYYADGVANGKYSVSSFGAINTFSDGTNGGTIGINGIKSYIEHDLSINFTAPIYNFYGVTPSTYAYFDASGNLISGSTPGAAPLADVLAIGNLTNELEISSNNSRSIFKVWNGYSELRFTNGGVSNAFYISQYDVRSNFDNGVNAGEVHIYDTSLDINHSAQVLSSAPINAMGTTDGYSQMAIQNGSKGVFSVSDATFVQSEEINLQLGDLRIKHIGAVETGEVRIRDASNYISHTTKIIFDSPIYNYVQATASKVAVFDASKNLVSSSTTLTQLSYLDATSSIQTQLNAITGAGYLTTISGIAAGGELAGTYANPTLVNSAVIGKVLTGLNVTGSTISATDTILAAFGKLQNQINGVLGGAIYQGTYNATTNSPALVDGAGTKGYYYVVNVAGNQNYGSGVINLNVGDWIIYNGSIWQKVDNTDAVASVNGYIGAVNLVTNDIAESVNLYYTNARGIGSVITGYVSGAGVVSATDTILQAIQKLNGNIGALTTGVSSVFGRSGAVVAVGGDYTTTLVTEGTNLYYTNARVNTQVATYTGDVTLTGTAFAIGSGKVTDTMLAGSIADGKLASSYIYADGSRALTADWAAGAFNITSKQKTISGTGGNGFIELIAQSSNASAPAAAGFRLFAGSTGSFNWARKNGTDVYVRTFDATLTADRTYTLQDAASTIAMYSNNLSVFASTTSAQLAGIISDETGSGVLVFATAPTFTTSITAPLIYGGTAAGSSISYTSTTGTGTTTSAAHIFAGGTNGATNIATFYNDGMALFGTTTRNPTSGGIFRICDPAVANSNIDFGSSSGTNAAIWLNTITPSTTNYAIMGTGATTVLVNGGTTLGLRVGNSAKISFTTTSTTFNQAAAASGSASTFIYSPANDTAQTTGTEKKTYYLTSATIQHAGSTSLALQRTFVIEQTTYSSAAATRTITDAVTMYIEGCPITGTNSAATNEHALYIGAITSAKGAGSTPTNTYGLTCNAQTGGTNNFAAQFLGGTVKFAAGTTTVAPITLVSGTNQTTAVAGTFEYDGTNLFFTRTGTTRETNWCGNAGAAAPGTSIGAGIVNYYGSSATNFLGTPNSWASIVIGGTTYKVPLYT